MKDYIAYFFVLPIYKIIKSSKAEVNAQDVEDDCEKKNERNQTNKNSY